MKKLWNKALVLAVVTAAMLTVSAFAAQGETGTVNADALRLRSEPSTSSSTITYLNTGAQVDVLEDLGEWYKVSCGGTVGYVYAAYISFQSSDTATAAFFSMESVAGQTGVITGSVVNFRSEPEMEDVNVLTKVRAGDELTIISVADEWCQASYQGLEGFVKADYISVNGIPLVDPRGIITGDCVNVRSIASTDGTILTKVYAGELVDLLNLENGWYAVSINGHLGYIRSDFLRVYDGVSGSGLGADIVTTARKYLGTRYVYGGASSKGFDCSGFTMYIFDQYGYNLPHSATSQWQSSTGTTVARADLQAGDLVFFCDPSRSNGKACSHVGIYVGDGDFIHASSSNSGGVRISSLNESYYNSYYVGAKRIG
ncbi:MAG: SH3 domain-containing protein [Oscillospiraceae bacterium]|nr:SH3 domain-containing protein [Oscillospiraceae bacterium]